MFITHHRRKPVTTTHVVDRSHTGLRTTAAFVALALSAVIVVVGNTDVKPGENGGTGAGIVTGVLCLVLAAVIFGFALARVQNTNKAALVYGIIGVVSLPVFW